MKITDLQKKEIEELGDNPVAASLKMHRTKLEEVSKQALNYIHEDLPDASIDQKIKVYDTTRRHLNIIDGIDNNQQSKQQIIIIPGELVKDIYAEARNQLNNNSQSSTNQINTSTNPTTINSTNIKEIPCNNQKSHSTPANQKSQKTDIVLESSIVEGDLVKHS